MSSTAASDSMLILAIEVTPYSDANVAISEESTPVSTESATAALTSPKTSEPYWASSTSTDIEIVLVVDNNARRRDNRRTEEHVCSPKLSVLTPSMTRVSALLTTAASVVP